MFEVRPTYRFTKKTLKSVEPSEVPTGAQLRFVPFVENGIEKQLLVLDIDTPNGHILANYIMAHLGLSRTVKTPNGVHIYYKIPVSDVKRLKSYYFISLGLLLEQGIIDEAYAKDFVATNYRAKRAFEKHKLLLFPIEVKKRQIMAPGSLVNKQAERVLTKLIKLGAIDASKLDPFQFVSQYADRAASLCTYKLDNPEIPLTQGIAEISASQLLEFFYSHRSPFANPKPKSTHFSSHDQPNSVSQKKHLNSSIDRGLPFEYSCPKRGNKRVSDLSLTERIAEMIQQQMFEVSRTTVQKLEPYEIVLSALEGRLGRITLGRAFLCPIHKESKPSVAFYQTPTGIRLFEFHPRTQDVSKSVYEVLFALETGIERRIFAGDHKYVYTVRLSMAERKVALDSQEQKAALLRQLALQISELVSLESLEHSKRTRLEKVLSMLLAFAANYSTNFDDDIFSVRFASKVLGYSKSTAHVVLKLLLESNVLTIVGSKALGKPRDAYVYSIAFDESKIQSVALRLLLLMAIIRTTRGTYRKPVIENKRPIDKTKKGTYNFSVSHKHGPGG